MKRICLLLVVFVLMLSGCAGSPYNTYTTSDGENGNEPQSTPVATAQPTEETQNNETKGETDPMKAIVTMKTVTVDKTDANKPIVTIEMESGGVIRAELYPEIAPITVENFISLIEKGFYNGLTFHRNIPGFVIQGGCPLGNGTGGPGYQIKGEFASNGVPNDLKHTRGVLSMARAMAPDSAGSQFFIMHADAPHLDGDYAAFGKVIEGMDYVDSIATSGM